MKNYYEFIIKPTYACNADCSYCSVHKRANEIAAMDKNIFFKLTLRIKEYLKDNLGDIDCSFATLRFIWLGGEPLLMSDDFYYFVIQETLQKNFFNNIKVVHSMQTNLILYEKKRQILKLLLKKGKNFFISTSFDPVSNARTLKNKQDYKKLFLEQYFKAKEDGVNVGMVYVVNRDSINNEKQIYSFFKNLGLKSFTLNSIVDFSGEYNEKVLGFTKKEYGDFLKNMWQIWEDDDFSIQIRPFVGWKYLKDYKNDSLLRCHNQDFCSKEIFGISPKGDIFECDRAMHFSHNPIGNIYKDSFIDIQKLKQFGDFKYSLQFNECKECKWWIFCKGGCPYESKEFYQNKVGKTYWCESYKILFEKIGE